MNDHERPDRPESDHPAPGGRTPPPGPRVGRLLGFAAVAAAILGIGVLAGPRLRAAGKAAVHEVAPKESAAATAPDKDAKVQFYTCGMHPWVILPKPGNCPICGMKLVPLDSAKFTGEVTIDPVVVQNIGVRVSPVVTGPLVSAIRTVGTVTYDERLVRDINTKVSGWIEKIHVDYLGALVHKGDDLFDLYSPDLYSAEEEYLVALRGAKADSIAGGPSLARAARTRLLYYDIVPDQISELERTGKPAKTMAIRSPYTGIVTEKYGNEGMKLDPGMLVYRVADLSKVWVMATLYEYQLPYVEAGQHVVMSLSYVPGQKFDGKIVYIYPYLSDKSREVKVRIEFDNSDGLLKPGMFANVDIKSELAAHRVLAPRSAIIDTGERQVAFVSLGAGKFEPRNVVMGAQTEDGMVEVMDGLKPGEMVVTSGEFLLDSESKMREALAKMIRGDMASDQKSAVAVLAPAAVDSLPEAIQKSLGDALNGYMAIGERLAADDVSGVAAGARRVAGAMDAAVAVAVPGRPGFWNDHPEAAVARGKALELAGTGDLKTAREEFADLSTAMAKLLTGTGVPGSYGKRVDQLHCPMFRQGQGGSVWLQGDGAVRNPYFGQVMLGCFDQRHTVPMAGAEKPASGGSGDGGE